MATGRRNRLWRRIVSGRPPDPWPEGAHRCPRCGRDIAGAIRPRPERRRLAPPHLMSRDAERVALCPICGPDGVGPTARPIEPGQLTAALRAYATACDAGGEPHWAAMLRRTADSGGIEVSGHALALLLRRGPHRSRDAVEIDEDELRRLLFDVVSAWPIRT